MVKANEEWEAPAGRHVEAPWLFVCEYTLTAVEVRLSTDWPVTFRGEVGTTDVIAPPYPVRAHTQSRSAGHAWIPWGEMIASPGAGPTVAAEAVLPGSTVAAATTATATATVRDSGRRSDVLTVTHGVRRSGVTAAGGDVGHTARRVGRRSVVVGLVSGLAGALTACQRQAPRAEGPAAGPDQPAQPLEPAQSAQIAPPADAAPLRVRQAPLTGTPPRLLVVRADPTTAPFAAAAWRRGVEQQAVSAGAVLDVVEGGLAGTDPERVLRGALGGVDGVLLHGVNPGSCVAAWRELTAAGMPVVAQGGAVVEMDVPRLVRGTVVVRVDDAGLTGLVLEVMAARVADGVPVGLVAPTPVEVDVERRCALWQQRCREHSWRQVLVSEEVATQLFGGLLQSDGGPPQSNASFLVPQLGAHPDVAAVFCSDETLAVSVLDAAARLPAPLPAPVFCVGGPLVDAARMVSDGSTWLATALVDEAELGAAGLRAVLLRLTGELGDPQRPENLDVTVPGRLVTQQALRDAGVATSADLWASLSSLPGRTPVTTLTAPWLPNPLT